MSKQIVITQTANGFIAEPTIKVGYERLGTTMHSFESITALSKHLTKYFKKDTCTCGKSK